ncbi:hypothetical protein ACFL0H_01770 [Thermodesulfobacteriota bacterium]
MNIRYPTRLFIIAAILFLCVFFGTSDSMENLPGSQKGNPHINTDIIQGIELLYDWQFDKAEVLLSKIIFENPMDPAGYFYLSMVSWSRMAAGVWSEENVEEYKNRIEKTIYIANKNIEKGQANSFTYLYLGGALGYLGRFHLMRHKWFSSYLVASEAIEALKKCLSMDPGNRDVLLGLGIYDYYTARLSGVLKFLSYIFFHKGSKEEGLRKLHITAEEATYSSIEAKSMLLHIYLFLELDFDKARPIADEMAERFRNGPVHSYLQGVTYIRLDMVSGYRNVVEGLRRRSRKESSPAVASIWANRADYLEAGYYLFHDQYDNARSNLEAILSNNEIEKEPYMAAWPLLKIGMSYDLEGKRETALEYYNRVLEMENSAGAQFLAEKYILEPVVKGSPFLVF